MELKHLTWNLSIMVFMFMFVFRHYLPIFSGKKTACVVSFAAFSGVSFFLYVVNDEQ